MKTAILALIMFLLLVTIHEFGHFIVAKLSGIKVNEFAVGMGPEIFSREKGETKYSLRLLPIGGYCAMEGEDDESTDPRSFDNAPAYKRFLTILAGPFMNLILAVIVFSIVAFNTGTPTDYIGGFTDDSKAKAAGIMLDDEVISIAGKPVGDFSDISKILSDYYEDNSKDTEVSVDVSRDGDIKEYKIVPSFTNGYPVLGITSKLRDVGVLESIAIGFKETFNNAKMILIVFKDLITGKLSFGALSGPVGVVKEIGTQAQNGVMNLLYFLAYISVNLAVFNLLPIPALDGSKLITSAYEMITKRKVNKKIEERVTTLGFFLLLGLIVTITVKDIFTLF